ncbi:hypothetical protein E4U53_003649 [Claviceps sorghi]|nr:hypothetical protein E4U53_003649 [Claviceps sorghi]
MFVSPIAMLVLAGAASATPLVKRDGLNDGIILNYALTLEHLEGTFYRDGLAKYTAKDFADAGFDASFYDNVKRVAKDESDHVGFLTTALKAAGVEPVAACQYNFGYKDVKTFLATASILEGVGVSAYLGAAADIMSKKYLTAAGSILTVEARHSSYLRDHLKQVPFAQPFDAPLSYNEVYSLASQFITACPATNAALPVKAFPKLAVAPSDGNVTEGSTVTLQTPGYTLKAPQGATQVYAAFIAVTGPTFVEATPVEGGFSCKIPKGFAGQTYVVLTGCKETVSDDTVAAGPAILETFRSFQTPLPPDPSMHPSRSLLLAWALTTATAAVNMPSLPPSLEGLVPTPPSRDPFYLVPEDIAQASPGSILRHRRAPGAVGSALQTLELQASHQILYRTTDSQDNATATVLTVLIPPRADLSRVLSYQVAEDAASVDCAPSYAFQLGNTASARGNELTEAELLGPIRTALGRGWVVIVPDFLGPQAAFLAGALSGNAVLDGVRAAMRSHDVTGIAARPVVTLWGYSGGSLASLWAAEQQPAAPSPTSPPVNRSVFAGLIPAGVLGLANQYALAGPLIDAHLLPRHRDDFYQARRACLVGDIVRFAGVDILAMFDDGSLVYTHPLARRLMADNALGHRAPRIPLFIYKAVEDEISPVEDTDRLVDGYCAGAGAGAGRAATATVQYDRVPMAGHATLAVEGAQKAFSWLEAVMARQSTEGFGSYKCRGA